MLCGYFFCHSTFSHRSIFRQRLSIDSYLDFSKLLFLVSWQIQKTVFVFCWKIINRSRSGNNLSLIFLDFNRNAECPSLAFVLTVTDKCLKMLLFYSDISILEKYRVLRFLIWNYISPHKNIRIIKKF